LISRHPGLNRDRSAVLLRKVKPAEHDDRVLATLAATA
jgi:hypothetical protein